MTRRGSNAVKTNSTHAFAVHVNILAHEVGIYAVRITWNMRKRLVGPFRQQERVGTTSLGVHVP
jgi:hypothetical protein